MVRAALRFRRQRRKRPVRAAARPPYTECAADDVKPGKYTSFQQAVKLKPDETAVFAWVVFASRKARDRIKARVMADPRLAGMAPDKMPFDTRRMFWGGFKPIVAL